jgi:hypothetical protein
MTLTRSLRPLAAAALAAGLVLPVAASASAYSGGAERHDGLRHASSYSGHQGPSLRSGRVRILGGPRHNDDRGVHRENDDRGVHRQNDDRGVHRQNDDLLATATTPAEPPTTKITVKASVPGAPIGDPMF